MATDESPPTLLTAEQYAALATNEPTELVRGVIVPMPMPTYEHGRVCNEVAFRLTTFVREHGLGEVLSNDAGGITEREPDMVRGGDVAFYSFARFPKAERKAPYAPVPPDLVFEVLSPCERWREVMEKVEEYLAAGVPMVCVMETEIRAMQIFTPDKPMQTLRGEDEFVGSGTLAEFRIPVRKFFE